MKLGRFTLTHTKKIQATTEGAKQEIWIDSLLTGTSINGIGCGNSYSSYSSQVSATFRKYSGKDTLGNWQTRALVDTRTAFISGEGLSIHAKDNSLSKWIEKFLIDNRLKGSRFFDFVKAGEMLGNGLFVLTADTTKEQIRIKRIPAAVEGGKQYSYTPDDLSDPAGSATIKIDDKKFTDKYVKYVKLAGAPCDYSETPTKIGLCLNLVDNYDRGMNAMRGNNHLFGRITPHFECEDDNTVAKINSLVNAGQWKIGTALATRAKLKMVVPEIGAMDNIKAELTTLVKGVSSVTGIPVHWLGHVDMMSNRSTSDSLMETVNNATVNERAVWAESFYDIIVMAQELAINKGFKDAPKTVNYDFEVKIPLIPFTRMLDYMKTLSLAFSDGAISLSDYQNMLPGVDPYRVRQNLKAEAKAKAKAMETLINKSEIPNPETPENNNQE